MQANLNFHPSINSPDIMVNDTIVFRSVNEHPEDYWVAPEPFEPKPERDAILSWLCQENSERLAKGMNPLATVNVSKGRVEITQGASPVSHSKIGRNDPCYCGKLVDGKPVKFKKCCGK